MTQEQLRQRLCQGSNAGAPGSLVGNLAVGPVTEPVGRRLLVAAAAVCCACMPCYSATVGCCRTVGLFADVCQAAGVHGGLREHAVHRRHPQEPTHQGLHSRRRSSSTHGLSSSTHGLSSSTHGLSSGHNDDGGAGCVARAASAGRARLALRAVLQGPWRRGGAASLSSPVPTAAGNPSGRRGP